VGGWPTVDLDTIPSVDVIVVLFHRHMYVSVFIQEKAGGKVIMHFRTVTHHCVDTPSGCLCM